jgi:hypothetical protein
MSVNLYASREGALYQSYDNYAGAAGFYDPSQDAGQQPGSSDPAPQASFLACDAKDSRALALQDPYARCVLATGRRAARSMRARARC